ncbi:MAG: polysaccharide biosynthesis/export family protein [Acidobacteriota bacterium]|nr:MAG: polysaccharide biosynthesis/export family protein [Acidobacteriota bacterium]
MRSFAALIGFVFVLTGIAVTASSAQAPDLKPASGKNTSSRKGEASNAVPLPAPSASETPKPEAADEDDPDDVILPYYENYLKEYRLGPSDIISVEVFGQCPDYCRQSITIPPNARISYPLIREGIMVAGRTVEQVATEIMQKLDEFIIDPKVTVTLEKAMSTRYSVMGNVANPGVRVMDRKVSVYEAILESGGVTKAGDKNKVIVVSYGRDGKLTKKTVSLTAMENGKAEMVFLSPGDQVFVGGKGFSIDKVFDAIGKASVVRFLFGSPF